MKKIFMKKSTKFLFLIGTMIAGSTAFAQKTCDIALLTTASPTTVNYGDTSHITVKITNNGTASLNTSDTIYYGAVGSATVFALVPTATIASGGSQTFTNALYVRNSFDTLTADRTLTFCLMLHPQSAITKNSVPVPITYNDPNAANDTSCMQITFKKKPVTGIFEFNNNITQLSIYPNPATTDVKFDVTLDKDADINVVVKDISGRTIMTKAFGKISSGKSVPLNLDVHSLQAGMYLVEVIGESKLATGKFVIK